MATEFVVIVVGVLVALTVDAWWSERSDRVRETVILSDLSTEFQANRDRLQRDIEMNERLLAATNTILELGGAGLRALAEDSVQSLVVNSILSATFDPSNAVLRSVVAAGEFHLVSNPRLRSALAAWDDGLLELRRKEQLASDWHTTYLFPRLSAGDDSRPAVGELMSMIGLYVPHQRKHRNAVAQARRQLIVADSVLALLQLEGQ
jgi:hypothetical protein